MGNKQAVFSDEQLDAYQDCTFFTRKEILRIYERYKELDSDHVPVDMNGHQTHTFKIPYDILEVMSELKANPFRRRICEVFSEEGNGDMSFDDFLDMFSVFSEASPRDVKAVYAFRIYDCDGDNQLSKTDLEHTLTCLTRNELNADEVQLICEKVLEEADLDDDGQLSYMEFEHVISRAPDFISNFHIRI